MGKNKFLRSKNEKSVGVGNDVICQTIFQFYKEFYDRVEWRESLKCVEFNTSSNAINLKLIRVDLRHLILEVKSFRTHTK